MSLGCSYCGSLITDVHKEGCPRFKAPEPEFFDFVTPPGSIEKRPNKVTTEYIDLGPCRSCSGTGRERVQLKED